MKIQKLSLFILLLITVMSISCKAEEPTYTIETTLGNIKVKLYEKTPLHKANFEKLVEEKVYDGVLFHRVIEDFMIQTGDPTTKPGAEGTEVEEKDEDRIPAEIVPEYFHKKGALAAARMGDGVNPEKKSSPTQFYIVHGEKYSVRKFSLLEEQTGRSWPKEQESVYKKVGGAPFLDREYTVFGEVVEGLDIVDKIAELPTDSRDNPLTEVRIITITKD
ncbi:MAG: peptidylprolyl isomerase [Bacteroidales bacterium]|nr:peptidylprolyl isomerase [Bacteroidales bacterium]